MKKTDLISGLLLGFTTTLLGCYLFVTFFSDFKFIPGIQIIKSQGNLGKVITIGSILTLIAFGVLLKMNKEMMARGVILAIILLTVLTLFI
jgi:hypothetical protein